MGDLLFELVQNMVPGAPSVKAGPRESRGLIGSGRGIVVSASFIEYRGQGFWCRDGLLEVWLAMLVDEIDSNATDATGGDLRAARECLYEHATIRFSGEKKAALDAVLPSGARCRHMVSLGRRLRDRVAAGTGEPLRGSLARRIGGALWQQPQWPARVLRVADSFLWLLEQPEQTQGTPA
jgi:hypothetical protein